MPQRWLMIFITAGYLIMVTLFAVRTPAWQAPDEPAHYNYIAAISAGELPVIRTGDWDSDALDAYKAARWQGVTDAQIAAIRYENHQPPLYYALGVPVYALTGGSLTALRLYSALWGLVIIWCGYGIGLLMFPNRPEIGIGAAGFVAFQPMHVHILASVNNDALGWAVVAVGLLLAVAYVKDQPLFGRQISPLWLGLLVGIGLITKATTYFLAGIMGIAILLRWLDGERDFRALIRACLLFLIPALLLGGLWWGRNISVYGWPDFLGLREHDAIVIGQPRTEERIAALGIGAYIAELLRTTFNSFWGQFGWMAVPLRDSWYAVIGAGLIVAFAGLGADMAFLRRGRRIDSGQRAAWAILALTTVAALAAYLYYNSEFQQYQGRYTFPLLIPLGIWLALGFDAWRRLIFNERGRTITAAYALPLALFSLYLIWRVIPPNL